MIRVGPIQFCLKVYKHLFQPLVLLTVHLCLGLHEVPFLDPRQVLDDPADFGRCGIC